MEIISEGSPIIIDLDDFLGGAETEEELGDLMEKFLSRCHSELLIFAGIQVSSEGIFHGPGLLGLYQRISPPPD